MNDQSNSKYQKNRIKCEEIRERESNQKTINHSVELCESI